MPLTRRKKITYSLLTVLLVLVLAAGAVKLVASRNAPKFYGNYKADMFVDDTLLGYTAKPCEHISSTKVVAGDTIYETSYNIDCNGLRTTSTNAATATKHLLFFGCSFTFGEGLPDSATFPYLMNDSVYHAYNFGMPGYGPQQMLVRLEDNKLADVKEPSGIAIYTLLPDHIYRAIGAPYVLYYWGSKMPYYTLEEFGVEYHKSFQRGQPFRTLWYKALGFAGLMNVESIARPAVTQQDIDLVVAMIVKSKRMYLSRYPSSQFFVLAYPSPSMGSEYEQLITALKESGINVIDYRESFYYHSEYVIEGDGHPNRKANRHLAYSLKNLLNPISVQDSLAKPYDKMQLLRSTIDVGDTIP